jgi:hypothetical protein
MEHLAEVLFQLFWLLLAAKLGDEIFKRIGQPAIIGEIVRWRRDWPRVASARTASRF